MSAANVVGVGGVAASAVEVSTGTAQVSVRAGTSAKIASAAQPGRRRRAQPLPSRAEATPAGAPGATRTGGHRLGVPRARGRLVGGDAIPGRPPGYG